MCGGGTSSNSKELKGLQLALEEQQLSLDALHQRREPVTGSGWGYRLLSMFILLGYETTRCPEGFSVFLRECFDNTYIYIVVTCCYMLLPSNMWISTVESYRSYRSQNVPTSGCFGVVWCMSGHQVVFLGILIPLFSLQYIPMMTLPWLLCWRQAELSEACRSRRMLGKSTADSIVLNHQTRNNDSSMSTVTWSNAGISDIQLSSFVTCDPIHHPSMS